MMAIAHIHLEGVPVAKGRPRFTRNGRVYTPAKTAKYEKALAAKAQGEWRGRPLPGPLKVSISVALPIPKSWSAKKRAQAVDGGIWPTGKPDGDNFAKTVGDALNGIMWVDDSQIVFWQISKYYDATPSLHVTVEAV